MRTSRRKLIAVAVAAFSAVVIGAHVRLGSQASAARRQHAEALGRSIPLSWHADGPSVVTVPATATYRAGAVEPYHYALKLRTGHRFPASVEARSPGVPIAYFVARPAYPWWYVWDVLRLGDAEVLALDETYAVFAHPKRWLAAQRLTF